MYKLMIVDDEPIIIRGLRECVDWNEYNITIAGEAENGMEALKKALVVQPEAKQLKSTENSISRIVSPELFIWLNKAH